MQPPPELVRPQPPALLAGLALLALALGYADAQVLLATGLSLRSDVALKLAAVAALPLPLGLLGLLTTPRHAALRRMLGESAGALLDRSLGSARLWTGLALLVPVGMLAASRDPDVVRAAGLSLLVTTLAVLLGVGLLLAALRVVVASRIEANKVWQSLTGGGAFGPAEAAPLLYAPAFALVGALVPAALLSALWGAAPDLLTLPVLATFTIVTLAIALGFARAQVHATRPLLQDALLAVEAAHATPFASHAPLPEPPGWLTAGDRSAMAQWLGRAWTRRFPGSLLTSGLLAALAAWLPPHPGPIRAAVLAATLALYGAVRAATLRDDGAFAAATWLGATPGQLHAGMLRLGLGLALPSLTGLLLVLAGAPILAILPGLLLGAALGLLLLRSLPHAGLSRLALLTFGAALAWATASA
jgi:hypothetical protein